MRDPEVVFLRTEDGTFSPLSYRQDGLGIDREYCQFDDSGRIVTVAIKEQRDTATFCNMWMLNIEDQQEI